MIPHAAIRYALALRVELPSLPLSDALRYGKAAHEADCRGLHIVWENDPEPWDCDVPRPRHVLSALVYQQGQYDGFPLASLHSIGVDRLDDPYLDIIRAELYEEALTYLDQRDADDATVLAERATYAAGGES